MDAAFYGLTTIMDLRVLGYEYCTRNYIPHPFNRETKMAGKDFVSGFLKRNKDLSLRKPQDVALNNIDGLNKTDVCYFLKIWIVFYSNVFEPHQTYNCDETGLTCVHKQSRVKAPTDKHVVSSEKSGEKGVTTTVLCAVSATGHYVPPLMIFKRKRLKLELTDNAPAGTIQGCSKNGWVNTELFIKYIKHFVKFVNYSKESKVLLIF